MQPKTFDLLFAGKQYLITPQPNGSLTCQMTGQAGIAPPPQLGSVDELLNWFAQNGNTTKTQVLQLMSGPDAEAFRTYVQENSAIGTTTGASSA